MTLNLHLLDAAVKRTLHSYLFDQGALADGNREGYHHQKILPNAQRHLTRDALETRPRESLLGALKADVNLLHAQDRMKASAFAQQEEPAALSRCLLDLLYGNTPLEELLISFLARTQGEQGPARRAEINATVASYLLALSAPERYAFCKPEVYKAAARALLGPVDVVGGAAARIAHATEFYSQLLRELQQRHHLPLSDLLQVHNVYKSFGVQLRTFLFRAGASSKPKPRRTHRL